MRLGTKLFLGFLLIIAIAVVQAAVIFIAVDKAEKNTANLAEVYSPAVNLLNGLEHNLTMAGYNYRAYFYVRDEGLNQLGFAEMQKYFQNAGALREHCRKFPRLAALGQETENLIKGGDEYQAISKEINLGLLDMKDAMSSMKENEDLFEDAIEKYFGRVNDEWKETYAKATGGEFTRAGAESLDYARNSYVLGAEMMEQFDMGLGDFWQALATFDTAAMIEAADGLNNLSTDAKNALQNATRPQDKETMATANRAVENVSGIFRKIEGIWSQMLAKGEARVKIFTNLLATSSRVTEQYAKEMQGMTTDSMRELAAVNFIQIIGVIAIVVLGLLVAYFLTRGITRPLNQIIDQLTDGSGALAKSADAIGASSKDLSEGATNQAASLEETSSALDQLTAMTRKNAENAKATDDTTRDTAAMVERGAESVRNMTSAMGEINDSSEKIGNIIKTIEGIAFQTNLLALNAAVEAARAGEAGKGFAVVADEVRNLAQRSAQAARDTNELIAGTVERVRNGSQISSAMEENFKGIEEGVHKAGKLVSEIASATNEQALGVEQINTSVAQMDRVTQATAQESQRTFEESQALNEEAGRMNEMVYRLTRLVHGQGAGRKAPSRPVGGSGQGPKAVKVMKVLPLSE